MNFLPIHRPSPALPFLLIALLTLSSCGPGPEVAITQTRTLPEEERKPPTGATSAERFRIALAMAGFNSQANQNRANQPQLVWETPEGWTAVSGNAMRQADLRFGEESIGQCYVMRAGGSLEANVNRWRNQMGLEALPEDEVKALPKRQLFGMEAYLISLEGNYTGMGAQESSKDYRMLGVILPFAELSLFVKMIGPKGDVTANEEKFHAFCDSLRIETS